METLVTQKMSLVPCQIHNEFIPPGWKSQEVEKFLHQNWLKTPVKTQSYNMEKSILRFRLI